MATMGLLEELYQVTLPPTYQGQDMTNVFYYLSGGASTAASCGEAFETDVLPYLRAMADETINFVTLGVKRIVPLGDEAELALNVPGLDSAGETLGPFVTNAFLLQRSEPVTRNGSKRLFTVPEVRQTNGVITSSAFIALISDAATAMAAQLADPGFLLNTFLPVIVKRLGDAAIGYRLPETRAETIFSAVADVVAQVLVTSQVSRKFGS